MEAVDRNHPQRRVVRVVPSLESTSWSRVLAEALMSGSTSWGQAVVMEGLRRSQGSQRVVRRAADRTQKVGQTLVLVAAQDRVVSRRLEDLLQK